jgi:hypothetical protein
VALAKNIYGIRRKIKHSVCSLMPRGMMELEMNACTCTVYMCIAISMSSLKLQRLFDKTGAVSFRVLESPIKVATSAFVLRY